MRTSRSEIEPLTRDEHRAMLEALASMNTEQPCPIPECESGWIPIGGCGGHLCDWPGHLDERGEFRS